MQSSTVKISWCQETEPPGICRLDTRLVGWNIWILCNFFISKNDKYL